MTTQESFKKRVRARMAKTGERYGAARRAMLATRAPEPDAGGWVSRPEISDERIREGTGHGWDEWRDLIDAAGLRGAGHTAIARWVGEQHPISGWWAQAVTVGYERIVGLRLPGQMADGTFTANASRTLAVDPEELRTVLTESPETLLPGVELEVRSRPGSRSPRIGLPEGSILVSFAEATDGRTRVSVAHEKLPSAAAVEVWKSFWRDWLADLADA